MLAKYSRSRVVTALGYIAVIAATSGPGDKLWTWTPETMYLGLIIALPGTAGIILRRRNANCSLILICFSAFISLTIGTLVPAMLFLFDASYLLAKRFALTHRWHLLIGASFITALAGTFAFISSGIPFVTTMLFIIGISVWLPIFWGLDIASAQQLSRAERERALAAMQSVADRAELAVAEERVRMASELHDTVSSRLAAIALQAQAARTILKGKRENEIIKQVHSEAIQALGDMKIQISLLSGAAPLDMKQVGFNEVSRLVERSQALGQAVELEGPELHDLSPASSHVLYKIVHEALLNAAKHAPGEKVEVRWSINESSIDLFVTNRIPARLQALSASSTPISDPPASVLGTGLGLSLLERHVLAFGGQWFAGPIDYHWCIKASISNPVPWSAHTSVPGTQRNFT